MEPMRAARKEVPLPVISAVAVFVALSQCAPLPFFAPIGLAVSALIFAIH